MIQIDIRRDVGNGYQYDVRDHNGFLLDKGRVGRFDAAVYSAIHSANHWTYQYRGAFLQAVVVRDWTPFNDGRRLTWENIVDRVNGYIAHRVKHTNVYSTQADEHTSMVALVEGLEVVS